VSQGIDFSAIVTKGTLQSGIAYARRQSSGDAAHPAESAQSLRSGPRRL
jgi:hypothetical protein